MADKLGMHAELTEDDRCALLGLPFTVRSAGAGEYLVREGERVTDHFVLASGYAYQSKLTSAGDRQIISIYIPGDAVACPTLFLDIADHSAQALTRAEVAVVSRGALRELARTSPAVGHAILMIALIEGSIMAEWLLNVGRRDARSRVAHLLCEFAVRHDAIDQNGNGRCVIPLTQVQIGDVLGLTPIHVNRMLRSLKADGLIEWRPKEVRFLRWDALRKVADFTGRYLHLDQAKRRAGERARAVAK